MDPKTYDIIQSSGGYVEFENLMKQGRQMHDQAVFDLFARMVSNTIRFVKRSHGITIRKQDPADHYQGSYVRQSSRYPV